jgi:hypothetical protein
LNDAEIEVTGDYDGNPTYWHKVNFQNI